MYLFVVLDFGLFFYYYFDFVNGKVWLMLEYYVVLGKLTLALRPATDDIEICRIKGDKK